MGTMLDPKEMLVALINNANGTNYRMGDVTFLPPFDRRKLPGGVSNTYNTSVRIQAGGKEYPISYDRIDNFLTNSQTFWNYSILAAIKVPIYQGKGESLAAGMIRGWQKTYGIIIEEEDIVVNSVSISADGRYVSWLMSPKSWRYAPAQYTVELEGQHVFYDGHWHRLVEPSRVQPDSWYEDHVDWLKYDLTKTANIAALTAGRDYTPIGYFLRRWGSTNGEWDTARIPTDSIRLTELAQHLTSCDGMCWEYVSTATPVNDNRINLRNCYVVYNGSVANAKKKAASQWRVPIEYLRYLDPANKDYENVLILRLESGTTQNGDKATTASCALLHYNSEVK